ncbi:hypothetical protein E2C01_057784 [Portunus trituberculatus]|uniref:Uncharacterized protein n=1 Tax=Portunus trituberculatus TaxID=210409 RepID=A0A5B7GXY2_PORTR|nr:hypothetical protein [Portunus trituberculatus]
MIEAVKEFLERMWRARCTDGAADPKARLRSDPESPVVSRSRSLVLLRGSGTSLDKRTIDTIRILFSSYPQTPAINKCKSVYCSFLSVMELCGSPQLAGLRENSLNTTHLKACVRNTKAVP